MVSMRLPGPVAWEWGRITGIGCSCGKPDFLVVQAEPIIPSKMPRVQPTITKLPGLSTEVQATILFAVMAVMALMLAVAFAVEFIL